LFLSIFKCHVVALAFVPAKVTKMTGAGVSLNVATSPGDFFLGEGVFDPLGEQF